MNVYLLDRRRMGGHIEGHREMKRPEEIKLSREEGEALIERLETGT